VDAITGGEAPSETNAETAGTEAPAADSSGMDIPVAEVPSEEKKAA